MPRLDCPSVSAETLSPKTIPKPEWPEVSSAKDGRVASARSERKPAEREELSGFKGFKSPPLHRNALLESRGYTVKPCQSFRAVGLGFRIHPCTVTPISLFVSFVLLGFGIWGSGCVLA